MDDSIKPMTFAEYQAALDIEWTELKARLTKENIRRQDEAEARALREYNAKSRKIKRYNNICPHCKHKDVINRFIHVSIGMPKNLGLCGARSCSATDWSSDVDRVRECRSCQHQWLPWVDSPYGLKLGHTISMDQEWLELLERQIESTRKFGDISASSDLLQGHEMLQYYPDTIRRLAKTTWPYLFDCGFGTGYAHYADHHPIVKESDFVFYQFGFKRVVLTPECEAIKGVRREYEMYLAGAEAWKKQGNWYRAWWYRRKAKQQAKILAELESKQKSNG